MADSTIGIDIAVIDGSHESHFRWLLGELFWELHIELKDSSLIGGFFRTVHQDTPEGDFILTREEGESRVRISVKIMGFNEHTLDSHDCFFRELGNVRSILSRYSEHFAWLGDLSTHLSRLLNLAWFLMVAEFREVL